MADIKIVIGGDIRELQNELKKGAVATQDFAKKSGKYTEEANIGLKEQRGILKSLQLEYAKLSTSQVKSPFGKELAADIRIANQEIKRLEAGSVSALGAVGTGANNVFGTARKLAYILPGIGIAGIFGVAATVIYEAASAINIFSTKLSDTARQSKLLSDVNKELAESGGKEIGTLEALYKVATNTVLPIKERKKAVDELQKQYPEYFKNLKDEIILQGQAGAAYDKTKLAILDVAKTRAIENKLSELATKELELQQKKKEVISEKDRNAVRKFKADASKADPETRGLEQFAAISQGSELTADLSDINDDLAKIAKDRDFLLNNITNAGLKDENVKTREGSKKALTESLNADFDIYKIAQERKIRLLETGINDEKIYYPERLALLRSFIAESQDLINAQEQNDIKEIQKKRDLDVQNLEREKKKGADIAGINANIATTIANAAEKIRTIQAKSQDDSYKLLETSFKKLEALREQHNKIIAEFDQQEIDYQKFTNDAIRKAREEQAKALDKDRQDALKKLEEYQNTVAEIVLGGIKSTAESIGKVLVDGNVGSFFSGILKTIGEGLIQLGGKLLAASKLIALIKASITKIPQIAIAASIGLIVLGSALVAAAGKQGGFATGTRFAPGGTAIVGERGPELITLPQGSSVTPNAQLNAMGTDRQITVIGRIDGKDILLSSDRARALNSRNG